MATRYTFKTQVKRDTTCESCGCRYYYIDDVNASGATADKAAEAGRKLMETGFGYVPCPRCRKMNANMRRGRFVSLLWILGVFALFAWVGGSYVHDLVTGSDNFRGDGSLGDIIGRPLAVVAAMVLLAFLIYWPFAPGLNHDGVVPGEEDKAPDDVRAKINAFNRSRTGG